MFNLKHIPHTKNIDKADENAKEKCVAGNVSFLESNRWFSNGRPSVSHARTEAFLSQKVRRITAAVISEGVEMLGEISG